MAEPQKPKGTMSPKEIEQQRKILSLEAELADVRKEQELNAKAEKPVTKDVKEDVQKNAELDTLRAQVSLLSDQIMKTQSSIDPTKIKYKPVPANDWQEVGITFSARKVYLIVGSYINERGLEVLPPYKLIKLQYAASDIKKDGNEETIVNFCTFTTHLKEEIKFLRNHPAYGFEFFENMNEANAADNIFVEFRTRAAQQVRSLSDEAVIQESKRLKVTNFTQHSVSSLRTQLIAILGNEYIRSAQILEEERAKKRLLASQAAQSE